MATGQTIVMTALERFKHSVTAADVRDFRSTRLDDVKREARTVEQELACRRELRYMRRIEPYLQTLDGYAGVLEVLCQGYPPMAFIWGPIKLMLRLARNYTSVIEKIVEAFGQIAEVLPRVERLRKAFGDSSDFYEAMGLIYRDLIEFHQRTYKFFRCKAWHIWFAVNWGLFERRFGSTIHKLSKHYDLLDKVAAATHFTEMKEFRIKHESEEEAFEKHLQCEMKRNLLNWLSAAEGHQEDLLHDTFDQMELETCNWLLEDPQMQAWIGDEGGEPILWMTGIPGSGKSVLSSFVIQHLVTQQDRSTLYYFCGKRRSHEDTCATILRTLTIQLLRDNQEIIGLVHQAFYQNLSTLSVSLMKKMLCDILPVTKGTRLIIDGIDEIERDSQNSILKSLIEVQKRTSCNCKILISSREEPQIQRSLLHPKSHLQLGDKTTNGLEIYIAARLQEIENHHNLDPSVSTRLRNRLHGKAKGMFLWVRLVAAMIMQCISKMDVEQTIDRLPEGLHEAYGQILDRVKSLNSRRQNQAFKILSWVCVAHRPVRISEIADGVVLGLGHQVLDINTRWTNPEKDFRDLCAPLLEISNTGIVDLVHFSAKEYLLDEQSGPFIVAAKAHFDLAIASVINLTTALDLIPQQKTPSDDKALETRVVKGNFGLQPYGHEFWAEHSLACLAQGLIIRTIRTEREELIDALKKFSRVLKRPPATARVVHADGTALGGLNDGLGKLRDYPVLYHLISTWLMFKSRAKRQSTELVTVAVQQKWKLEADETWLSLMASHLDRITGKILMMKRDELPPHIDAIDYDVFVDRYNLPCRFADCEYVCLNTQERDIHEAVHVPAFPCFQCDLFERGFKTRKDLEKHIRRYHMRPEDFTIPADLTGVQASGMEHTFVPNGARLMASTPWNEEGQRVLQRSFRQAFCTIESRLMTDVDKGQPESHMHALAAIRRNIESQSYQSLSEFKTDMHAVMRDSQEHMQSNADIECKHDLDFKNEIENAMSQYPNLANFDHETCANIPRQKSSMNYSHPGEAFQPSDHHLGSTPDLDAFAAPGPYWSLAEKNNFPELLRRCGHDFLQIADHLKTKSAVEVGNHFRSLVEGGAIDLAENTNLRPTDIPQQLPAKESSSLDDCGLRLTNKDQIAGSSSNLEVYVPDVQHLPRANRLDIVAGPTSNNNPEQAVKSNMTSQSTKGKRKPRPRAPCPQCNTELHDEYALKRHGLRFHTATRKVWLCEDISIDKKFLTKCKSCSANKRYSARRSAEDHLRLVHLNPKIPLASLHRWTREIEEPNPSFRSSTTADRGVARPTKRQKTEAEPVSLPPILFDPSASKADLLPPIKVDGDLSRKVETQAKTTPSEAGSSVSEVETEETPKPSEPEIVDSYNQELLASVSFDNVLPRSGDMQTCCTRIGPPHRIDQTLIKPDQVPRLPHLDSFRRAACQDQVDALYHKLDTTDVDKVEYEENLADLSSLSQTLMRDLRDWRRHSYLAPDITPAL